MAIGLGTLVTGLTAGITYWATRASESKMENPSNKIETSGAINNIVVTDIQDKVEIVNKEMLIALNIICGIKILEFCYFIYRKHVGAKIKRKLRENNRQIETL